MLPLHIRRTLVYDYKPSVNDNIYKLCLSFEKGIILSIRAADSPKRRWCDD